ncbi:MAG: S9 family peptidase [Bryobacteraceae bacterium]
MKRILLVVSSLAVFSVVLRPDVPRFWTPEFSMQVQTIGAVVPSPDGEWVAYTQSKPIIEGERSETVSQVYLARSDGSRRFQLTRGEHGSSAPAFSKDGRYVYFTSDRSGKSNVYRILAEGGEAEKLTDFKGSLGEYRVSPDGKSVAFVGHEPSPDAEKAAKEKRDFKVVDQELENFALYVIPAEADAKSKRLQKKVFEAKYHIANFDWSPDNRSIAFEHWPGPLADNWTRADIAEVDVTTGALKELASTKAAEAGPHYSPDGRYLAFEKSTEPARWPGEMHIALMSRSNGTVRLLHETFDDKPTVLGWSGDSRNILFTEAKKTRRAVYTMPVDGPPKALYEPAKGVLTSAALDLTGTHLGFSYETPSEAPEAYVMAMKGGAPRRISRANDDLPKLPLGDTQVIHWKGADGLDIEGLLTYPAGYEAGKKYPLILNIHGGPTGVFAENYIGRFSIYPLATFASRGYAILRPNPRGSGGYGKKFRFGNLSDWGGKDYEDDMAGVDHVIAMGVADPDHLAVMGWSYGGFMTSWIVTHTNRFKAACVGAGVTNLWSFTGTADIPGFLPDYFGGEPWDQFKAFTEHSPMSFVKNVKTPTLVLHGESDVRVPTSQGYELYHALKRMGVTTKMVVYPRTPHGPREPKFILDIAQRNLDWTDRYAR